MFPKWAWISVALIAAIYLASVGSIIYVSAENDYGNSQFKVSGQSTRQLKARASIEYCLTADVWIGQMSCWTFSHNTNIERVSHPCGSEHEFLNFHDGRSASHTLYIRAVSHWKYYWEGRSPSLGWLNFLRSTCCLWLLIVNNVPSVYSHVDQHFISSIEFSLLSRTISPQTYETTTNLAWLNNS